MGEVNLQYGGYLKGNKKEIKIGKVPVPKINHIVNLDQSYNNAKPTGVV